MVKLAELKEREAAAIDAGSEKELRAVMREAVAGMAPPVALDNNDCGEEPLLLKGLRGIVLRVLRCESFSSDDHRNYPAIFRLRRLLGSFVVQPQSLEKAARAGKWKEVEGLAVFSQEQDEAYTSFFAKKPQPKEGPWSES